MRGSLSAETGTAIGTGTENEPGDRSVAEGAAGVVVSRGSSVAGVRREGPGCGRP